MHLKNIHSSQFQHPSSSHDLLYIFLENVWYRRDRLQLLEPRLNIAVQTMQWRPVGNKPYFVIYLLFPTRFDMSNNKGCFKRTWFSYCDLKERLFLGTADYFCCSTSNDHWACVLWFWPLTYCCLCIKQTLLKVISRKDWIVDRSHPTWVIFFKQPCRQLMWSLRATCSWWTPSYTFFFFFKV